MTIQEAPAAAAKLAFGATFRAAFATIFGRFRPFVRVAALPLLLSIIVEVADLTLRSMTVVGTLPLDPAGLGTALLELTIGVLAMLPFAFLGIAVTRQNHVGPQSGLLPSPPLGRRTWVYTGYLLLLVVAFVLIAIAGFFAGIALLEAIDLTEDARAGSFIIGGVVGFCALLYLVLRLSLVLPAVALDEKLGLMGSWRLTRRSGMKLLGAFLLLFLVLILTILIGSAVTGSGEIRLGTDLVTSEGTGAGSDWMAVVLANTPRNLWNLVANFFILAMVCGALASAYAQLSGWGGLRAEILERFE